MELKLAEGKGGGIILNVFPRSENCFIYQDFLSGLGRGREGQCHSKFKCVQHKERPRNRGGGEGKRSVLDLPRRCGKIS